MSLILIEEAIEKIAYVNPSRFLLEGKNLANAASSVSGKAGLERLRKLKNTKIGKDIFSGNPQRILKYNTPKESTTGTGIMNPSNQGRLKFEFQRLSTKKEI